MVVWLLVGGSMDLSSLWYVSSWETSVKKLGNQCKDAEREGGEGGGRGREGGRRTRGEEVKWSRRGRGVEGEGEGEGEGKGRRRRNL